MKKTRTLASLSRHDRCAGHQLCRLRHPARRVAAAFRLRRQVRDPLGHAQPRGAWKGRGDPAGSWWLVALIILSGLSALIAMSRAGIRAFWAPVEASPPRVLLVEMAPVATLLGLTLAFTLEAGPAMRFMEATAASLRSPIAYVGQSDGGAACPSEAGGRPMSRVFPYPLLIVSLILMWLLLTSLSLGQFIVGMAVALAAAQGMAALHPARPRIRRWSLLPKLVAVVLYDIVRSNIAVAGWSCVKGTTGAFRAS